MELNQRQVGSSFGSGNKGNDEFRCRTIQPVGQELPVFERLLCVEHSYPYKLSFNENQSDCLSLTLSFAIFQLCDRGQPPYPLCASSFLLSKMEITVVLILVAGSGA